MKHSTACSDFNAMKAGDVKESDGCICAEKLGKNWKMKNLLLKFWYSLNYRYCMAEAYLASNRREPLIVADWLCRADEWHLKYVMHGRTLHHEG